MESKLSRGIIPKLFNSHVSPGTSFTFQVSSMREMKGGAVNGFRLKINDGQFENQYVMYNGPQLAELQINSIVTGLLFYSRFFKIKRDLATKWEANLAGGAKTVLSISSAKILHTAGEVGSKLGNPTPWKMGDAVPGGISKPIGKENTKPQGNSGRYVAVQTLTPYMNKWTIKARCISKDQSMRSWNNAKGAGTLFGFVVADATADLKVTAFKEEAEK